MRKKVLQILPMYDPKGEEILRRGADVVYTDRYDEDHLCQMVQGVHAIVLRAPAKITRRIIEAADCLEVISGAGVGVDNIDVLAATERGIPVLHAPHLNNNATAEHTVALMLSLSKMVVAGDRAMRRHQFSARDGIRTMELRGKRLGLVGFGRIAQRVAEIARQGFGMQVMMYVRTVDERRRQRAEELQVQLTTDLAELFSTSDIVSLHVPLTPETRHMVNRDILDRMQPHALLINTARGGVVDHDALYQALKEKKLAGAALDVFDPEPPEPLELFQMEQVITTPHIGGLTREATEQTAVTVAENVLKVLHGQKVDTVSNPEVFQDR